MDTIINTKIGYVFFLLSVTTFCITSIWFIHKDFALPRKVWCLMILVYFEELVLQAVFTWHLQMPIPRPLGILKLIPTSGISYMCFLSLTDPGRITKKFLARHLIPFSFFLLITFIVDYFYGWRTDLRTIPDYVRNWGDLSVLFIFFTTLYLIVYLTWVLYHLITGYRDYCELLESGYSPVNPINRKNMLSLICVLCFLCVYNLLGIVTDNQVFTVTYVFIVPVLLFYFYSFGIEYIQIPPAGNDDLADDFFAVGNVEPTEDTGFSDVSDKYAILKKKILKYVEEEKPYLNKDLKLQDLAFALNTNRSYISQTLNQAFDTNFYAFINTYRVQHAVKLMQKKPGRVVEYYAEKSGFKSRSVFFTEFKKATGYTPYQYTSLLKMNEEL